MAAVWGHLGRKWRLSLRYRFMSYVENEVAAVVTRTGMAYPTGNVPNLSAVCTTLKFTSPIFLTAAVGTSVESLIAVLGHPINPEPCVARPAAASPGATGAHSGRPSARKAAANFC